MVAYRDPASEFNDALGEVLALVEAGRVEEALAALDALAPSDRHRAAVLSLRCEILLSLRQWAPAARIAEALAKAEPRQPAHWVHWAYAARRYASLADAEKILREASALHPGSAVIAFNLACYCAQSQRLEEALAFLRRAVELDEAYALAAKSDPDLAPLRTSLPPGHWLAAEE